jgi:protein SCO1/2
LPRKFLLPILYAVVFIAGLVAAGLLFAPNKPALSGSLVQSPVVLQDFELQDAYGGSVHPADFQGKITLFFFGYTLCPDMSPTMLSEVNAAFRQLGERSEQVRMVMISVDPDRDTPGKVAEYAAFYNPSFIGLSGTPDEVAAAAKQFNVIYYKHEGSAATGYLIDHTATLTLVDAAGQIREVFEFGTSAADIAADVSYWLDQ